LLACHGRYRYSLLDLAALKDIKRQAATVERLKVRCETLQRQIASLTEAPPTSVGKKRGRPAEMEVADRMPAEAIIAPAPAPGPSPSSPAPVFAYEPIPLPRLDPVPIRAADARPAAPVLKVAPKLAGDSAGYKPKRPSDRPRTALAPLPQAQQAAPQSQDKAASLQARLKAYQRL
jgi:hypothetical protein